MCITRMYPGKIYDLKTAHSLSDEVEIKSESRSLNKASYRERSVKLLSDL